MFAREMLKESFLLSYFSVTKSTKSQQGGLAPSSLQTTAACTSYSQEVVRGKCVRQRANQKSAVSRPPQSQLYHACEHITRKNRADSCTHCLHARYKCRAGVNPVHALTGWSTYFFAFSVGCTWILSCRGRRHRRPEKCKIFFSRAFH